MGNLYSDSSVGLDLKMSHLNSLNKTLDQNQDKWHHYQMLNLKITQIIVRSSLLGHPLTYFNEILSKRKIFRSRTIRYYSYLSLVKTAKILGFFSFQNHESTLLSAIRNKNDSPVPEFLFFVESMLVIKHPNNDCLFVCIIIRISV